MTTNQPRSTGHVEIRQRKSGPVYYAKLKLPDGSQPRRRLGKVWSKRSAPPAGYLTYDQAVQRLAAIKAGDDPLVNVEPSHITFERACEEHLRWLRDEKQRKPSTLTDYRNVIHADLIRVLGATTPIEEITTAHVESLKAELLGRVSHTTTRKVLVILHAIMARAKRRGWIATNPCEHAERVTVKRSEDTITLEVEQVLAVARAAATEQLGRLIVVAAFTGLRQGELLALRWRDVDFSGALVHVRRNYTHGGEDLPKSNRRRSVPLSDQAAVALDTESRRDRFTTSDDLVFPNAVGDHANADQVRDGFYAALDAAGLGHLRTAAPELGRKAIVFHDLRHTFGTLCVRNGIDVVRIQKWMGHSDLATTQRYLHAAPAHDDAARLTAAFGGPAPAVEPTEVRA